MVNLHVPDRQLEPQTTSEISLSRRYLHISPVLLISVPQRTLLGIHIVRPTADIRTVISLFTGHVIPNLEGRNLEG